MGRFLDRASWLLLLFFTETPLHQVYTVTRSEVLTHAHCSTAAHKKWLISTTYDRRYWRVNFVTAESLSGLSAWYSGTLYKMLLS